MAIEKKQTFNSNVANIKTKSVEQLAEKFANSMAAGNVRKLPGVPIVRPQRVTSNR